MESFERMVGAFSLVGSPVIDAPHYTCPCLCLKSAALSRKSMARKNYRKVGSLELSSSFVDPGNELLGLVNRSSRKQRKTQSLRIVSELGGQYDETFGDVKKQLLNYFTYKAVRTVLYQLYEMNPPKYTWFYNFLVTNRPDGDGKLFIRNLAKERQDLAERVMVTRLHLYEKWIKKCNHAEIYQEISDENLELMRERLMETVVWPSDDTNTEKIG